LFTDSAGIQFLQWCLPRLHLRLSGFRKVRRQVYRRISRRLQELALPSIVAYRRYLEDHPDEWATLDALCWISISRFYRDRGVFQQVASEVLPHLARRMLEQSETELRCWSAGCAGGEEPYTLTIIWKSQLALQFPLVNFRVVATDIDPQAIRRAERGCYQRSSMKELPAEWRSQAFVESAAELCLKDEYRAAVTFMVQDIRTTMPHGEFHLILCRNLAFTYFDETTQQEILRRLTNKLAPGGALIIGKLESLPEGEWEFEPWLAHTGVYRKSFRNSVPT
jgi:chemotaxis protein methyltransferase CheR